MELILRTQSLGKDTHSRNRWMVDYTRLSLPAERVAIIVCDVWDSHWCRGARERLDELLPTMDRALREARTQGCSIIHAPSGTLDFYADSTALQRTIAVEPVQLPTGSDHADPPLPIDDADGGADTGETETYKAWSRQHPDIHIDEACDWISDDGRQIYSVLHHLEIEQVLIIGVHTNMCILHRSFGIKQMVRWGVNIALIRDLTDAMYNPAMRPYVPHEAGTQLVVEFIEKFWCPTIDSQQLIRSS